jgi:hypothetical protein
MTAQAQSLSAMSVWLARGRFVLATVLLWAGLHFVPGTLLPHGLDRPLVLASSPFGPLAGLLAIAILWVGGLVASFLVQPHGRRMVLFVVGLALTLWAAEGGQRGGTMDEWLIQGNPQPGPPTSAPYWWLLADYAYLLIGIAGASVTGSVFARRMTRAGETASAQRPAISVLTRTAFALHATAEDRRRGLTALVACALVAGVATLILMGPVAGATHRGQVYFAVGIGLFAGVFVGRRVAKSDDPLWFWPAPFVLGVFGVIAAALNPHLMLPPAYQHINVIPAWGLARGLPVEVVGIGLVGGLWSLRGAVAGAAPPAGG